VCARLPPQFFNNQPLQPGEEASLEYRLFFPTNLPPRDFILKLFLFYSDSDTIVPAMVFNGVRRGPLPGTPGTPGPPPSRRGALRRWGQHLTARALLADH
jgi:hypothetical protein